MDVNPSFNSRRQQPLNTTTSHNKPPSLGERPVTQLSTRRHSLPPTLTNQLHQDPRDAASLKNRCHVSQPHEHPQHMPPVRG